ncbi:MAG: ACT domain-containing protein [Coriobacteriia bacterium]|nr:ACT domain-containing protein [Coriobacteriia bacterium]
MRCVISVLGKDRTGIVAAVSTALANHGVGIDDINQSILQDMFSMTMLVSIDEEKASFNEVQDALAKVADELGVQIVIQREDLFQFMYKI